MHNLSVGIFALVAEEQYYTNASLVLVVCKVDGCKLGLKLDWASNFEGNLEDQRFSESR